MARRFIDYTPQELAAAKAQRIKEDLMNYNAQWRREQSKLAAKTVKPATSSK